MATDPVCQMQIEENDAEFKSEYGGRTFYFCSEECKDTFDGKPEQYAKSAA